MLEIAPAVMLEFAPAVKYALYHLVGLEAKCENFSLCFKERVGPELWHCLAYRYIIKFVIFISVFDINDGMIAGDFLCLFPLQMSSSFSMYTILQ